MAFWHVLESGIDANGILCCEQRQDVNSSAHCLLLSKSKNEVCFTYSRVFLSLSLSDSLVELATCANYPRRFWSYLRIKTIFKTALAPPQILSNASEGSSSRLPTRRRSSCASSCVPLTKKSQWDMEFLPRRNGPSRTIRWWEENTLQAICNWVQDCTRRPGYRKLFSIADYDVC